MALITHVQAVDIDVACAKVFISYNYVFECRRESFVLFTDVEKIPSSELLFEERRNSESFCRIIYGEQLEYE